MGNCSRIRRYVIVGHVLGLAVLLAAGFLPSCHQERPMLMRVDLVEIPAVSGDTPVAPTPDPPTPAPPQPPTPPAPTPPAPTPPAPTPPVPKPPTPAPIPTPKPPPPTPTPPAPTPPKWQARTPDQIRQNAKLSPVNTPAPTPRPTPTPAPVNSRDIAARMQQNVNNRRVTVTTGPAPTTATAAASDNFNNATVQRLYALWNQPSRQEVGGREPRTAVTFRIAHDGSVLRKVISAPSGNAAMDASVRKMLDALTTLPAPSAYGLPRGILEITVVFELDVN